MKVKVFTVLTLVVALMLSACGKSDADLQKAATDKLAADKITGVTVVVKDGVATLSGQIVDITVKTKAETSVKSVEGIKSVVNTVTVQAPPTPPPAPDPKIQGTVDEALRKAGCTGVKANVQYGKVTLTGTVAEAKITECMRVVQESGAGKVENLLEKVK